MTIEEITDGQSFVLVSRNISPVELNKVIRFGFSNVDHLLILEFGDAKLEFELGRNPDDAGEMIVSEMPEVKISGAGKLRVSHISIFKDIHYTSDDLERAGAGEAFTVGEDEFFVCGDNSPDSYDSRRWVGRGLGNNAQSYTSGIVPRDYLVGKAFFLYWGGAFRPFEGSLPFVPNISEFRFIQNGSDSEL